MKVLAALLVIATIALVASGQSICDRYSAALNISNTALVGTVVNGTIAKLVNSSSPVKVYFDGTKPSGSTNFLTNANALNSLYNKLIDFFWAPLGCSEVPARSYTGRNMSASHQYMGIVQAEADYFARSLYETLTGAGVTVADADAVNMIIYSLNKDIVARSSICDRYSDALKISNDALVGTVVNGTIAKLVAATAPTKKYFDGTKPAGSTNFLDAANANKLNMLYNKLVDFFWAPLGCTDLPKRTYAGRDMKSSHAAMMINDSEQAFFAQAVYDVLIGAGVTTVDATTVKGVVESLNSQIVTPTANTSGFASALAVAVATVCVSVSIALFY